MNATLKNTQSGETIATDLDGENVNPQPIKPAIAEAFEFRLNEYARLYEEATDRIQWRGGVSNLRRYADTDTEQAEKFLEAITELENRIALWQEALTSLRMASIGLEKGEPALYQYEQDLQKWHAKNRHYEMHEANPEEYSLHAIAVKKVICLAQEKANVKWNKRSHYWMYKDVYATVNGLTPEEVEQALDEYIQARQMSYTVSTKNLKMKVA